MKNLKKVILVVLVLSLALAMFGGCSINDVDPTVVNSDSNSIAMQVFNGEYNQIDDVINLEVTPSPTPSAYISITSQPQSCAFFVNSMEYLNVVASSSNSGVLTYVWFVNGYAVSGSSSQSFEVSKLNVGEYKMKCKISAVGAVDVFSEEVTLTILPKCNLNFDIEGDTLNIVLGEKKFITASVDNDNILFQTSYSWRENGYTDIGSSKKLDLSKLSLGVHFIECSSYSRVGSSSSSYDRRSVIVYVSEKPLVTPEPSPEVTPIPIEPTPTIKPIPTPTPAPFDVPIWAIVIGCAVVILILVVVLKLFKK